MLRCVRSIALVGLTSTLAANGECVDGTCKAQSEDASMLQVARKSAEGRKSSFALNSKPFISSASGELPGAEQGRLIIDEDGELNTYYLPGAHVIDDGKTVEFRPPYRFYLMREPTTDYSDASKFYKPAFAGKTFSVDMNFGPDGPGCGCNLNFYLVDMPVPDKGKDGDYYCDAQCFPGLGCCAEFDMNEGNAEVQQITNHACTHDYGGHPDWACHKWGEPEVKTGSNFGPGPQHTIDSRKPFTFSQKFDVNGNDFTFTTTMSQEGREVALSMGPGNSQLNAMLKEIEEGMAFVTGYWFAPDMNWMDGDSCGGGTEHCNMNPAYISNWRLTSNGSPVPSPAPTPPGPNPNPSPNPNPAPAPSSGGKCCWGAECTNCKEDSSDWCNQAAENCWQCGTGGWCSAR